MLDRDPRSFPSPLHAPLPVRGPGFSRLLLERPFAGGQTANFWGWGDGVRARPFAGPRGRRLVLHVCTIFKGPTRSLHQLITEVQVKNSMRVNSTSAER